MNKFSQNYEILCSLPVISYFCTLLIFSTMQVHHYKRELEKDVAVFRKENKNIGFVPTMGALHQGHMTLVEQALQENEIVIVSIFVNPTQFNNSQDLKNYPRTLEEDLQILSSVNASIIVFAPSAEEVYGNSVDSIAYDFGGIEFEMEGKFRPGHFDGVGTVLKHLFEIVTPTNAYFGEKDFQQLQIVRKLVTIENMDITIVGCPIYRESSGLAYSSRNKRLSQQQLLESPLIYKSLNHIKTHFGTKSVVSLSQWVKAQFDGNSILDLEYFVIADIDTLKPATEIKENKKYRAFIAAFAGEVRLIDNIALN